MIGRAGGGPIFGVVDGVAAAGVDLGVEEGCFRSQIASRGAADMGRVGGGGEFLVFAEALFVGAVFGDDAVVIGGVGDEAFDRGFERGGSMR